MVAVNVHNNYDFLRYKVYMCLLYGGPWASRQHHEANGKTTILMTNKTTDFIDDLQLMDRRQTRHINNFTVISRVKIQAMFLPKIKQL